MLEETNEIVIIELAGGLYLGGMNQVGVMAGHGIKIMENGSVFHGNFSNGKMSGPGTACFFDGSIYDGLWGETNGLPHGKGLYLSKENQIIGRNWFNYINMDVHKKVINEIMSQRTASEMDNLSSSDMLSSPRSHMRKEGSNKASNESLFSSLYVKKKSRDRQRASSTSSRDKVVNRIIHGKSEKGMSSFG
jgi:hypothetical protein